MKNEYSHIQDAFQYTVTGYNRMARAGAVEKRAKTPYKRIGNRTGL